MYMHQILFECIKSRESTLGFVYDKTAIAQNENALMHKSSSQFALTGCDNQQKKWVVTLCDDPDPRWEFTVCLVTSGDLG